MHFLSLYKYLILVILSVIILNCQNHQGFYRPVINLAGQWQFATDTADVGIKDKWFLNDLQDSIVLPGTMDLNQKGFENHDTTTMHLNRLYVYEGPAWYRKKITIPAEFNDKHIQLVMERTKSSRVWVDEHYVGASRLLQSAQVFDVTSLLSPGEHFITIRVNNDLSLTPYGNVHIYTDETQTNWNGIIGDIVLQAAPRTYISDLQLYPDIDNKKVRVNLSVVNGLGLDSLDVILQVKLKNYRRETELSDLQMRVQCDTFITMEYDLTDQMMLWDEYQHPLYQMTSLIKHDTLQDIKSAPFAMRKFATAGRQFVINDRVTFLRGKNDAAIFPLTGYTPMDIENWLRVFSIAKSYGINHYRFHSYCPPKAAFEAADQLGIFLQPELPFWGGLESDTVAAQLKREGVALLKSYANHPSFVMFSAGNEIWSGHDRFEKIMTFLKEKDGRPLYTMGSNNNIGYMAPPDYAEFFVAARTPYERDTTLTHTRLTHAFSDSRNGALLNSEQPSTMLNFDYPVSQINMPLISHEIGQYQIYPDYTEIEKYSGVVKAWNLEVFRNRLQNAGMSDQDSIFQKASGALSALCYKAEMEAALRTEHMAGFQLLDLQDFPGQGTALVGILDAFMDSKKVISREEWLQSCNDVVLLLEFPKYVWQSSESFQGELAVANYSNKPLSGDVLWQIVSSDGQVFKTGTLVNPGLEQGKLSNIAEINVALATITKAQKLTIKLKLENSSYTNTYPIWVYPAADNEINPGDIIISQKMDNNVISALQQGKNVLLFPDAESVKDKSVDGLFPPDFWNYGMFKMISGWNKAQVSPGTLGILTDPAHPMFNSFPTDFHSNWQWWSIIKNSRPLILDKTAADYRPIIQIIDNMERNHKLGLVFEFSVGQGKLLISMARLPDILDSPEARQLYISMINYMKSEAFAPKYKLSTEQLFDLL